MDKEKLRAALPTSKDDFAVIGNPLRSNGQGNILGAADEILDLAQGKFQSEINAELTGNGGTARIYRLELDLSAVYEEDLKSGAADNVSSKTDPLTEEQLQALTDCGTNLGLLQIVDTGRFRGIPLLAGLYEIIRAASKDSLVTEKNPKGVYGLVAMRLLALVNHEYYFGNSHMYMEIVVENYGDRKRGDIHARAWPSVSYRQPRYPNQGMVALSENSKGVSFYDGSKWLAADGQADFLRRGTTTKRPTALTASDAGFTFYDTTLKKPLWWDGAQWKDSQGNVL